MAYVECALCPVPVANREAYLAHAATAAALFKKHGALAVQEHWGDDVPEGKVNSMRTAVMLKPDETVVVAMIVWPSKAVREEAWPKISADPAMSGLEMPFDGSRMIFGGFERVLEM